MAESLEDRHIQPEKVAAAQASLMGVQVEAVEEVQGAVVVAEVHSDMFHWTWPRAHS